MTSLAPQSLWRIVDKDIAEAADALRTLAAIQDEIATVESLGGVAGRFALAASVYDHLRGADGEALRDLADRLEMRA